MTSQEPQTAPDQERQTAPDQEPRTGPDQVPPPPAETTVREPPVQEPVQTPPDNPPCKLQNLKLQNTDTYQSLTSLSVF